MKKIGLLLFIIILTATYLFSSKDENIKVSSCQTEECHSQIETVSDNHQFSCVSCHGGDNVSVDKSIAHQQMLGGKNPADPSAWEQTCQKCHLYQVQRVSSSLMMTNAGIIYNTSEAWGDNKTDLYATRKGEHFDQNGNPISLSDVMDDNTLSGELYRKFCGLCHVGSARETGYQARHSSGCAACHFLHDDGGKYQGTDKTLKDKKGYAATHEMLALPTDDVCLRCHNRSGRIALSYKGLYDGNNSLVPVVRGRPGPELTSGFRNVRNIHEDIHRSYGMECIDCHTSRDLMGDGYFHRNLYDQIEVTCDDCHGTAETLPKTKKITTESDSPLIESKSYKVKAQFGDEMVLTSKGRMYSNVKKEDDHYYLYTKRKGKKLKIKTITGTSEHQVSGHERLECYTCHSKTVVQCYGCHTEYDRSQKMKDWISGEVTPGRFTETEDIRSLFPFPLAVNQRGKISPVTPGCQTFVTVKNEKGEVVEKERALTFRGKKQMKFAPFYSHNTAGTAIGCRDCHGNLTFAGFGDGLVAPKAGTIDSSIQCDVCEKPLTALYHMKDHEMVVYSDVVRDRSRVLNSTELIGFMNANTCIICHDRADPKIYGKPIDYETVLSDKIHRPLLSD